MGSARNLADLSGAFNVANGLSNQNRIINGDLRVQQYPHGSGTVTVTTASPFVVDRFRVGMSGANGTAQRIASGVNDIPYKIRMTGSSGTTTPWFGQYIESVNCIDLVGQSLTVTYWAASSNLTSVSVNLKYLNTADSSAGGATMIAAQTAVLTPTLTKYKVTFTNLPAQAANGLYLEFVPSGSLGTGTFDIGGIDLRKGLYSGLLPSDWRQAGQELALCQRYFYRIATQAQNGVRYSGTSPFFTTPFPVTMRATPTVSPTLVSTIYTSSGTVTGLPITSITAESVAIQMNNSVVGADFGFYYNYTASAEI